VDAARRVRLGRTKLDATRLGLGCASIGNLFSAVDEAQATATIDAAWDAGIRLFDTAPLYGHGLSEMRLGRALEHRRRDEYVLSTKVGRVLDPGADRGTIFVDVPALTPRFDFSSDGVRRSLDESLERLGVDRIDVVHVHDPDDHADEALVGAFPALCALRDEGVIGAVGAGMNQAELLTRFVREVDLDCVLLAGRYSLLSRTGLRELLPLCAERDVAVIVGGVFNSGLLADPRPGATYNYAPANEQMLDAALRLDDVCRAHAVPLKAAALQFPFGHAAVTSVLVGARTPDEIRSNVELLARPIPATLWDELITQSLLPADVPLPVNT
jgi:D-threo-aldose 1-dehydrogenase